MTLNLLKIHWHRAVVLAVTALAISCDVAPANTVRIEWTAVRQTIDGFGAATNETNFGEPLSERVMDFFYTTAGIGFTFLRVRNYPEVAACEQDSGPGYCLSTDSATILNTDLRIAKMAVARGARVWSAEWSPPASMKTNGAFMKGGAMIGNSANYARLADILAHFVTLMASNGVSIYSLSPQNEPDMSTQYPSATWTPVQIHDFIPYLHEAFQKVGVTSTKIMIAEESSWRSFSYAAAAMNDPSVAAQVAILAAHNYDQSNPAHPPRFNNVTSQRLWQTEASTFDKYDGSMTNALMWAQKIHYFLSAAQVSAFHYWYLTAAPNIKDNEALTDLDGGVARRAYAIGNWSKFVRPGWHEVAVMNSGSLLVSAFQNETRTQSAIVVVNDRLFPVAQTFEVGTAMAASVTPWITSSSYALTQQSTKPISAGAFSYTLPARSIVTLVGQSKSGSVAQ